MGYGKRNGFGEFTGRVARAGKRSPTARICDWWVNQMRPCDLGSCEDCMDNLLMDFHFLAIGYLTAAVINLVGRLSFFIQTQIMTMILYVTLS